MRSRFGLPVGDGRGQPPAVAGVACLVVGRVPISLRSLIACPQDRERQVKDLGRHGASVSGRPAARTA